MACKRSLDQRDAGHEIVADDQQRAEDASAHRSPPAHVGEDVVAPRQVDGRCLLKGRSAPSCRARERIVEPHLP